MARIEDSKQKDVTAKLIGAVKTYAGICLIALLVTVPTKAVWLLITYLWNLI